MNELIKWQIFVYPNFDSDFVLVLSLVPIVLHLRPLNDHVLQSNYSHVLLVEHFPNVNHVNSSKAMQLKWNEISFEIEFCFYCCCYSE